MKSSLLSLLFFFCVSLISAQAQFTINGPETLCTGTSATLTATGCGGTLKWSTDATSASITVSPTVTTTYFATCTVGSDKSVASISPIVVPNITISSSGGNCFSGSATLTANSLPTGGTLRWKKDGILIPDATSATYEATQPGSYTAEPQAEAWTWQNPLPDGEDLNDIHFNTDQIGLSVGNYGKMLRTTNGGETWNRLSLSTKGDLVSLSFIDQNQGWVVASNGVLLKTTDAGNSWTLSNPDLHGHKPIQVQFLNSATGWILTNTNPGVILKTTDGGDTWIVQNTGLTDQSRFTFINAATGFITAKGNAMKTVDGGSTWNALPINHSNANYIEYFKEVAFLNENVGFVTSVWGTLLFTYKTSNGGLSWQSETSRSFTRASFISPSLGVVVKIRDSQYASILDFTFDGGASWRSAGSPSYFTPQLTYNIRAATMKSDSTAWAACGGGAILKIKYLNQNLEVKYGEILAGRATDVSTFDCVNSDVAFFNNWNRELFKTNDKGKSWIKLADVSILNDIKFVDNSVGYKVYPHGGGDIIRSTDGGVTWSENINNSGYNSVEFKRIKFLNYQLGYAYGKYAGGGSDPLGYTRMVLTLDGGTNWSTRDLTIYANDISFASPSYGWAVGNEGMIIKSINGGSSWTNQSSGTTKSLKFVHFTSVTNGWAAGDDILLETRDGGISWMPYNFGSMTAYPITSLDFKGSDLGWATTNVVDPIKGNLFFKTTNGGQKWSLEYLPTNITISKMCFPSASEGWIFGSSSRVMRYAAPPSSCASNVISITSIDPFFTTIKSGFWDDPTIWDCGGVPSVMNGVRIDQPHTVTLPTGYTAKAKSIEMLGNMQQGANAGVQIGQD